ncbi:MAG: AI-2E family transporter [Acidimicrobiales bacterium]
MSNLTNESHDDATTRRSRIFVRAHENNVPLKTILVATLTVVVVIAASEILYRLRDILLLMLVGGFIVLLLNPLVNGLQHWKIHRRGFAVLIVMFASVLVFIGLAVAFGYPLVNSTTHLANALPSYFTKAQHGKGWIGHLLRRYHIKNWFDKNSSKLISLANGLSKPALALGRGAVTIVLALVTLFAFVVLLLLEGPKLRAGFFAMTSPKTNVWISRVGSHVSTAALGYMVGNLATSLIAGFVIFITLLCLSVPFAILWALWVALVDFIPQIGGILAGIPTVLFALVHSLTAGIVTAIVFVLYSTLENHVLNPVIMSRTVRISPLTVFLAILVGAEMGAWVGGIFGGFVAVLLAVPAVATFHVLFREIWNSTRSSSLLTSSNQHAPHEITTN